MAKILSRNKVGSSSQIKPSHFFKIVTFSNVHHHELRIPRKFINENGNNFRDFVILKAPSGPTFLVELATTSNGDVWFSNGFKRFADYYSIRPGHLLVFKYKGYANFNVIIFDKTASEIEYPFNADHDGQTIKNINSKALVEEENREDESVQILEDFPTKDTLKPTREVKSKGHLDLYVHNAYKACLAAEEGGKRISSNADGHLGAFEKARAFKSNKPFFIVSMGQSYIVGKSYVHIPKAFSEKHLHKAGSNVVLQVSCGRTTKTWSPRFICEKGSKKRCLIGLKMFASDNNIKVGDVCVFEMINHSEPRLNVHIFRASE